MITNQNLSIGIGAPTVLEGEGVRFAPGKKGEKQGERGKKG